MAFNGLLSDLLSKYPELKSFDSSLHQRTTKLINSLTAQSKTEYFSLDSLMEVFGFLLELSQDVVKTITESKEDVWKKEELRPLVDVYFDSTTKTLNLFNTVENCVGKAENSQLIIRAAVEQFETESDLGGSKKKKYEKTLEELNKFEAVVDPFGDEFVTQYESIYMLLEELCKVRVKLGKKQEKVNKVRNFPDMVTAVATTVMATSKRGSKRLNGDEKAEKTQKYLFSLTENRTKVNNEATETITILVEKLRKKISSVLKNVDYATERDKDELATKRAMQEIMEHVEGFTKKIDEVNKTVAKHSKLIIDGREEVLRCVANANGK